jgi:hypothetical protein
MKLTRLIVATLFIGTSTIAMAQSGGGGGGAGGGGAAGGGASASGSAGGGGGNNGGAGSDLNPHRLGRGADDNPSMLGANPALGNSAASPAQRYGSGRADNPRWNGRPVSGYR